MESIENKVVFIAGGTGGVGEGLVKFFLQEGAMVVVPSRDEGRLESLREFVGEVDRGELRLLLGDISTEEGARAVQHQFYTELSRNIDLLIDAVGTWWQGLPLTSIDLDTWNAIVRDNLTSHFLAIKLFIPLVNPQTGVFIHTNGYMAEEPVPMAAPMAMVAAAQKALVLSLAKELEPTKIRVYELILGAINTRSRMRTELNPDWYFPEEIAEYMHRLAVGRHDIQYEIVHRLLKKES